MASADGLTVPKPAIPKTLGILNVIFAVLLLLMGTCVGVMTLIAPEIQKFGQKAMDQVKAQAEQRKAADLKVLDDREQAATADEAKATTDEAKATIATEKAAIAKERAAINNRPLPATINMTMSTDILKDPIIKADAIGSVVSGLMLHIALLIAGIGLIRLTAWGRTLTLWWAGLQIAQLLILAAVNFTLILPIQQKANEAVIADLKKQLSGPNAPPNAEMTVQATEFSAKFAPVIMVFNLLAGVTYPIICLILLRTAGARAACLARPAEPYPPPSSGF